MQPFFSIITVSYNAEKTISDTLKSILTQTYTNFEIILQDGASTDNTLSCIPEDTRIKLVSEKDDGIYDAMNRATARSSGEYCIFMNCGDCFATQDVLQKVYDILAGDDRIMLAYGDFSINDIVYGQAGKMTEFYLYRTPLNHQSMIIRTSLFKSIGAYDCTYKILADYDFTQRCFHSGVSFKHIPVIVCAYLGGGISESKEGVKIKERERRVIVKEHYSLPKRFFYDLILLLTLRKFRIWLFSGHSSERLLRTYRNFINLINRA